MKFQFLIYLLFSFSIFAQSNTSYILKHGDITLPIHNDGTLSHVRINDSTYFMEYDKKNILFSGGFYLSGYSNNILWANGVASASRIEDYKPGSYTNSEYDNLANLYIIKNSDEDFGESWQNWKDAVKLGADYYDGNYNASDGIGQNEYLY